MRNETDIEGTRIVTGARIHTSKVFGWIAGGFILLALVVWASSTRDGAVERNSSSIDSRSEIVPSNNDSSNTDNRFTDQPTVPQPAR